MTKQKVNAIDTEVSGISGKSPSKERELPPSFLLLVWEWEGPEVAYQADGSHKRARA